jgi:hypothetical protein
MYAMLLAPAVLSLLVLAAHFLRSGNLPLMLVSLGLLALLGVRRPWARRVLQGALALGAIEWVRTLVAGVNARELAGEDWRRLAAILGAVASVAVVALLALETFPMRVWFGGRPPAPPPPAA